MSEHLSSPNGCHEDCPACAEERAGDERPLESNKRRLIGYLCRDHNGCFVIARKHPRKELLAYCGRKRADKMYIDGPDGKPKHIGYVIARRWWQVLELHEWQGVKS